MPTWREIRLFCKRNKLVVFCLYIAITYIFLNVYVAESNVSLMRFKKSDEPGFNDLILLNDEDIEDLKERGVTFVEKRGGRSDRRNNFKDLQFVRDSKSNQGNDMPAKGGESEDSFYYGENDGREGVMGEVILMENNLPKNKFHEERAVDINSDELKREMLRGKMERFKRLDEIVREEKKEFGSYWDKVNKNKEKKKEVGNVDEDGRGGINEKEEEIDKDGLVGDAEEGRIDNGKIDDVGEDNNADADDENQSNIKESVKADDTNGDWVENGADDEAGENVDMNDERMKDNKDEDVSDVDGGKNDENLKKIKSGKIKKTESDKKSKVSDESFAEGELGLGDAKDENDGDEDDDSDGKASSNLGMVHEPNPVLDMVMTQLEKDKLDTFEVDLSALTKTMEEVKMPRFVEYGAEGDPGQNSTKYEFPEGYLPKELQRKREEDYTKNYFDLWVSNKIAVHRSLNDPRTDGCLERQYNLTTYPSVSIIIVFHNEAWTTLLRSLHSIIDRTPTEALLEIILVDDFSEDSDLQEPLEVYAKSLNVVRLIRATARLGLIKARNLGFLYSKGEIIIFLDSHIECFNGWLQPLVTPIVHDPMTVTFPIIDIIDKDNFGIQILPASNVGTLNFNFMSFTWERSDEKDLWYYRSPTMPGGLYAISRKWFHDLGAYDPGLKLWGGENLEISFKIWMCGGKLLASACSHVGHVFRTKSPSRSSAFVKAVKTNTYRLAEVWLDQYKHLYYEKINYKVSDYGDVSNQVALRKSLHCKSFDWYLSEINPKLKATLDLNASYSGLITNRGTGMCLQSEVRLLTVRKCDMAQAGQIWQLSSEGFLTNRDSDMTVMEFTNLHRNTNVTTTLYSVKMRLIDRVAKDEKAIFSYDEATQHLTHNRSQHCLDVEPAGSRAIRVSPCRPKVPIQKWELMTRKELQSYHRKKKVPIDWSV